jgi:hypothetical protein
MHPLAQPGKAIPESQEAVIDLIIQQPNLSDFRIRELSNERYSIRISRATIDRLRHLIRFKFFRPMIADNSSRLSEDSAFNL